MKKDLYTVLGIERSVTASEIKKAYFQLARVHHPDKGGDPEVFKEIQRAYEVLSNENSKQIYDMTGQIPGESTDSSDIHSGSGSGFFPGFPFRGGGMPSPFGFPMDELFGMFGNGMNGSGSFGRGSSGVRRMGKPPPKIQHMNLDLKQFYFGQNFNLNLDRQVICKVCEGAGTAQKESCSECKGSGAKTQVIQMGGMIMESRGPCTTCQGKGWKGVGKCKECTGSGKKEEKRQQSFSLKPGMKSGEVVVLSEICSEMPEFEKPGDLHVIFGLNTDNEQASKWIRQGKMEEHLVFTLQISLAESLLGLTVKIEGHPAYTEGLWVKLHGCLLNGDIYCMNDLGMPMLGDSAKYGNGYIIICVKPTAEERNTLLGPGRTNSLEKIFENCCRKAPENIQVSDIFCDSYLVEKII